MKMYDIIYKKREGEELTNEEIKFFVEGYSKGEIPDYQASALLMAIFFRGLSKEETFFLTEAMIASGEKIDLSAIDGIKVDKHSTGGVGDKTTLIATPLAASLGVKIAKMSGRGLGFTGGTVDKMESIPEFRTTLKSAEFFEIVNKVSVSVIGQSQDIATADKKLYALRDVTATVDNIGLITSSIMSKKLASGSDAIVLDVKCGKGAFMEKEEDAISLAEWMVDIGKSAGKKVTALVTDMGQPLGFSVGNCLEVIEVIETLKGKGPSDITELSLRLASYMVFLAEKAKTIDEAYNMVKENLENGKGLEKLKELIKAHGGNENVIDDYSLFKQPSVSKEFVSEKEGYISEIDAAKIGSASQLSGAGRMKKEDDIDMSAGIVLKKKVGDSIKKGEALGTVYGSDEKRIESAVSEAIKAYVVSEIEPKKTDLIKHIIK